MRLTLIQPKQNELYDFASPARRFTAEASKALSAAMVEQTFSLMETAPATDLVVTTEAVNYPGPPARVEGAYPDLIRGCSAADRFAAFAERRGCYVVAGLYGIRDGRMYNEALVFGRRGEIVARYAKVHLAGDEGAALTAGDRYALVEADFGRFGVCVCWDMQFPEVCRHYALSGARLVVCPTWGWEAVYAHARAYENGLYVAGAMAVPFGGAIRGLRTPSEVVAPDGRVLAHADRRKAGQITCEIDLSAMAELQLERMRGRRPDTYALLTKK